MALWRWFFLLSVSPWLWGLAPLSWQDSFLTRVELLALIETLNARLLAALTATEVLERWCAEHNLASDPSQKDRVQTMHAALVAELGEEPDKTEQRCRTDCQRGYDRPDQSGQKQKQKQKKKQKAAQGL